MVYLIEEERKVFCLTTCLLTVTYRQNQMVINFATIIVTSIPESFSENYI